MKKCLGQGQIGRRQGALARTRDYSWEDSKAKRLGKTQEEWEKLRQKHISHLESLGNL